VQAGRSARFRAFAGDPQHGGALLGVQVRHVEGEGIADPQAAEQQDGDQGAGAGLAGGGFPEPAGLGGVQRAGVGVVAVQLGYLVRYRRGEREAFGGGVAVEGQHRGEFAAAGGHLLPGRREVGEPAGGDPRSHPVRWDLLGGKPSGELPQVDLVGAGGVRAHGAQPAGQSERGQTAGRSGPDGQNICAGDHAR